MLEFTKMHGLGNDYIYIDTRKNVIPYEKIGEITRYICNRHFGIGADGIILIEPSNIADFKMKIYNSDGSEAEMCGNGIRCFGKYVYDNRLTNKKNLTIETLAGIKNIKLYVSKKENIVEKVTVNMGKSKFENVDELDGTVLNAVEKSGKSWNVKGTVLSMGNPHFVIFVDDLDNYDVEQYGSIIENHPYFVNKTNVEFIQIIGRKSIKMRVWERGAGETFACGTGACATFATCYKMNLVDSSVKIFLKGGELEIYLDPNSEDIYMTGIATKICEGKIDITNCSN